MTYVPHTEKERLDMLEYLGCSDIEELFRDIPEAVRLKRGLDLPAGKSEFEALAEMEELAAKNTVFKSIFRGAGSYDHYIPAVVNHLASRSELVTAYTPYQPEISQGVLQAIFEYQTTICMLTGMDASNAGVYDGSHAAAEAFAMCRDRKRGKLVTFDNIKPQTLEVLKTYTAAAGAEIKVLPSKGGLCDTVALGSAVDAETACVYIETPSFFGLLEDAGAVCEIAHGAGAKLIIGANPLSLAVLKTPAEYGADIAVGEAQPLGLPLSFGGPYLGYIAVRSADARKLPGRIAGETTDSEGRRALVLTLQAREQHIRREKAGSSICSNEALCAVRVTIYCAALGKEGLREVAGRCIDNSHYLASRLCEIPGFEMKYTGEFFNELVTACPVNAPALMKKLEGEGILGGLPLDDRSVLWCATEKNGKESIDRLIKLIREGI